jgi:hypothetical protein
MADDANNYNGNCGNHDDSGNNVAKTTTMRSTALKWAA